MTFIGILAILVAVTFTILAVIIARVRRQRANAENLAKTVLTQPSSSSHTSTACMSESTMRSSYEPHLSADESLTYSGSLTPANNNHGPRITSRIMEHRPPIHVCPKCISSCEYNHSCQVDSRRILYTDPSYYEGDSHPRQSFNRTQRVHSIIERRLSGASFVSDMEYHPKNYPTYLWNIIKCKLFIYFHILNDINLYVKIAIEKNDGIDTVIHQ